MSKPTIFLIAFVVLSLLVIALHYLTTRYEIAWGRDEQKEKDRQANS